jgi:hypothetical protein
MKTSFGATKHQAKVAAMHSGLLLLYPPPIYFTRKKAKTGDVSTDEANNFKTDTLLVEPKEENSDVTWFLI